MKQIFKYSAYGILIILVAFFFAACEKSDSKEEWGIAKIYMPQASIQSGGLNNNYNVPSGTTSLNKNYTVDSLNGKNDINVVLGVYRSGLQAMESYSVSVNADPDTAGQLISSGAISDAVVLAGNTYTLPEMISVPDGERETSFNLTINRKQLLLDSAFYGGKKLVLAVRISNPSKYELNTSLSAVIVIVKDWETLK